MEQIKFNQPNRNQEWGEKRNKRRPQEIANAKKDNMVKFKQMIDYNKKKI